MPGPERRDRLPVTEHPPPSDVGLDGVVNEHWVPTHLAPCAWHLQSGSMVHHPSWPAG
jgi:hypothetical protein